jgi:DNA-directed RNA polymerase subunit RPC12/RpoP
MLRDARAFANAVSEDVRLMKQASAVCARCGPVLAQKTTPNHVLHAILTLFTCALWGVVWLVLVLVSAAEPYLCTKCGQPVRTI